MSQWWGRGLAVVAAPMVLAGCSAPADLSNAEHAIELFHFELDQGQYATIWNGSGSEMRSGTSQQSLTQFLTAVHTKLGKVTGTKRVSWNVNYATGGTFTSLAMQTRFEHGAGDESFVFKSINGGGEQLVGYHINSMDLITH